MVVLLYVIFVVLRYSAVQIMFSVVYMLTLYIKYILWGMYHMLALRQIVMPLWWSILYVCVYIYIYIYKGHPSLSLWAKNPFKKLNKTVIGTFRKNENEGNELCICLSSSNRLKFCHCALSFERHCMSAKSHCIMIETWRFPRLNGTEHHSNTTWCFNIKQASNWSFSAHD
jgi:hypothetical protein